jgi:hypothetical protein
LQRRYRRSTTARRHARLDAPSSVSSSVATLESKPCRFDRPSGEFMNPCHTTAGLLRAGVAILTIATGVTARAAATPEAAHQQYRVVVLPVDGGTDSSLAGYLNFAPLNNRGTIGVSADTSNPAVSNSYTSTAGVQTDRGVCCADRYDHRSLDRESSGLDSGRRNYRPTAEERRPRARGLGQ